MDESMRCIFPPVQPPNPLPDDNLLSSSEELKVPEVGSVNHGGSNQSSEGVGHPTAYVVPPLPSISAPPPPTSVVYGDNAIVKSLFGDGMKSQSEMSTHGFSTDVHDKFKEKKDARNVKKKGKATGVARCSMAVTSVQNNPALADLRVQDFVQDTATVTMVKKSLCSRPPTNITKMKNKKAPRLLSSGLNSPMVVERPDENPIVHDGVPVVQETNGNSILEGLAAWLDAIGARRSDGTPPIVDGSIISGRKEHMAGHHESFHRKDALSRDGVGSPKYGLDSGTTKILFSEGTTSLATGTSVDLELMHASAEGTPTNAFGTSTTDTLGTMNCESGLPPFHGRDNLLQSHPVTSPIGMETFFFNLSHVDNQTMRSGTGASRQPPHHAAFAP